MFKKSHKNDNCLTLLGVCGAFKQYEIHEIINFHAILKTQTKQRWFHTDYWLRNEKNSWLLTWIKTKKS